jgi:hypothetical protein
VRFLVAIGLCGLLLSMIIMSISTTHAATGHACASPVPPIQTATPTIPTPTQGLLVINEALLNPASIWNCDSRSSNTYAENAWIEIYNPQNYAVDLYAERAAIDTGEDTQAYTFPFGSVILAHEFFIVFPFINANFAPGYFTNPQPLTLRLDLEYTPFDQVTVPVLPGDVSYARTSDGGTKWEVTSQPTLNSSNVLPLATATPTVKAKATASTQKHKAKAKTKAKKQRAPKSVKEKTGSEDSGKATIQQKGVNTTQPAWQQMHLPTLDQPVTSNQANPSPQPTVSTTIAGLSLPQKIMLTLVSVVLAFSLFGIGLLFLRQKRRWSFSLKKR